jgi:chemotaxis protein MotB
MSDHSRQSDVPIIIIKKKKGGHGGHHGGAWKVAYADFVTAMMALFIVLWIVGQSKQVKEYIAQYFKDPGAFSENTKGGGAFESAKIPIGERLAEENLKRQEQTLKEMGEKIMEEMKKTPAISDLAKQITIEITKEGMRIELIEQSHKFFFDIGTAHLKEEAMTILAIIGAELAKIPNHLVIEGHTDARQYQTTDGYTNYELSADRANSARRVLMKNGLTATRLEQVAGYADRRLRNPQDPLDVVNRRVSILIRYDESGGVKLSNEVKKHE